MMSTSKMGEGLGKIGRSKGGCVNFIVQVRSKCGQGGEGVKNPKFLWKSLMEAPNRTTKEVLEEGPAASRKIRG